MVQARPSPQRGVRWQGSLALFHFLRGATSLKFHPIVDGFGTLGSVLYSVFHNGGGDMSGGNEREVGLDAFAVLSY